MSKFIPLPPTYAVTDPQVRAVLDVLARNMQVVIDAGTSDSTALTVGGGTTFGTDRNVTNITNLSTNYTLDTLTADLKRGAAEVISGALNGTTVMKLEPAGQYVVFQHKDAIVLGNTGAYSGSVRTALGITSTGILGGYNDKTTGDWQTTFAIESATGNLTVLGTIRANSIIQVGAYLGTQTVSSVLADVSTAASDANLALADAATALAAATTAQADAAAAIAGIAGKLDATSSYILTGKVGIQNTGGISIGNLTWNSTTGAITGGSGIAITEYGLVGAQGGVAKFYIDAAGNAVFGGSLSAATGTFAGTLSAAGGTFTGSLTAASGTFTGSLTSVGGTFTGSLVAATGTFAGSVSAGNVLSTGAVLGTTSGTNFWLRGSDGASYFGGDTTVKGRFTVSGTFAQSGYGDIGAAFTTNAGGASIYATNSGSGASIYASSGTGAAASLYNTSSGTFGLPTLWAQNNGTGLALRATSSGQTCTFTSTGGGYAFIAFSSGATGATAFVQGDFALGYSNSRGDPWIMRAPSTTVAAAASYYLNSDGTWKTTASIVPSLSSDSNSLGGITASSWTRIFATNSGNANAGGSGINLLGSTSTGIAGAYVGTSGTSNIVTFTVQATSPSDIRLKEEIADSDLGLAFVKQLRPVSYKLKADPKHQKGYGFIADEVELLGVYGSSLVYEEPDWKVGDEVGFKTIHYPSYVAVLTKAIQELSAEIETLKARG